MSSKIVLALTATAALSAALLIPTTSSARPFPGWWRNDKPVVGLPYFSGLPALPGMVLVCNHTPWGGAVGCRWVPRVARGGR
jgi:hypothetical protein